MAVGEIGHALVAETDEIRFPSVSIAAVESSPGRQPHPPQPVDLNK